MSGLRSPGGLCVLFIVSVACGPGKEPPPTPSPAPATEAFVGTDACRPCHAEIASTFARTGMGRSWYPMQGAPVIEDWTRKNAFDVPSTGLRYKMTERGGKFFVRQSIDDGRGGETAVDERELIWVVGSGNHSRQYLIEEQGKLFQAPVCWHTEARVWDLCPGYEYDNLYFARETGRTCVFCHNDRMTLLPGERNAYQEPIAHGIGCERCHGPGGAHVAKWEQGTSPTGQPDPTIVNPKRLSPEVRVQVCFPCHLGDAKATERVSLYQASLEDWRPGRPITTAVLPYRFTEATVHDFGLSAQADRMMQSRCFKESGGKMECLTCHNPHVTIFRADRAKDFFNAKCMTCHDVSACTAPAALRHATKPADDCVSCHMRKGVSDDQLHVRYTDHWIRTRIDQPRKERSQFDVEPFFPEMVSKMPPGDQAFFAARAISLRTHVVNADAKKAMWPQAEAKFREALAAGYAKADGPYFLGLSLTEQGRHAEAAEQYAAAYEKDSGDFDIAFAYGQSLMRQRRTEEAEKVFAIAVKDNPKAAGPIAEQARARAERGDYEGALALFRQAMALEPWTPSIHVNAAKMLSALERHDEAIAEVEEALRRDPEGPKTWNAYAMLLARAGRTADAQTAAKRAKELSKAPGLRSSDVRAAM